MEYKVARVIVTGVEAWAVEKKTITRGMTGAVVEIEYRDPMWEGLKKCVVFEGYSEPVGFLANSNTVVLPWEVTTQTGALVKVGVYGEDAAGNQVIPTIWAELGNVRSAPSGNFNPPGVPTPTPWAQILAMIGDLKNLTTEARDNLVNAINEAAKTGSGGSVYILTEGETIEDAPEDADIVIDPFGEADEEGSAPGEAGGYYTPGVTQPDADTVRFAFTASKEDMPAVAEQEITLPAGPQGPQGEPGEDYVLTDADKNDIAQLAAALVDTALLDVIGSGEVTA